MTVDFTWALEFYIGTAWVDVSADIRASGGLSAHAGLTGSEPTDRTADVGQMSFILNNDASNSGTVAGYYSPDYVANCRSGFELGTKARWSITYGGTTKVKFQGKIVDIAPDSGIYGPRGTPVTVADYINEIQSHNVSLITTQTNKRPDQLLGTVIANLPNAPTAPSYAVDPDTYANGLIDLVDEKTSALTAVQHIGMSGLGYTFMKDGDTLAYESRLTRLVRAPACTFTNTMRKMEVKRSAQSIKNTVKVQIPSPRIDTAVQSLYTLRNEIVIPPSTTLNPITMRYTDAAGQTSRVSMVSGSEKTQVADTDYKMSSVAGNNGNDLNANLVKTITYGGNAASTIFQNTHASATGYVNKFILSGKGIYLYDPLEFVQTDVTSKNTHGDYTLTYNAAYQNNPQFGDLLAKELLRRLKNPHSNVEPMEFIANRDATFMTQVRDGQIGDKITVTETQTGINKDFFINGIEYDLQPPSFLTVRYILEPVWAAGLFILDVSQLDGTDITYF